MKLAQKRDFRQVFQAKSDVGGRYSAFTDFGLVPAALIGMDIHRLLEKAWIASENCSFCVSEEKSSGLILGAAIGELAKSRDKVTFLASRSITGFPDWIEQLIAESTGKDGRGIVPVVNEPLAKLDDYGEDRFFILLFLDSDENREIENFTKLFEKAGHPVVRINLSEIFDIGREIFWWEVAVASAGSVIGIHPFDQPDVQLAKDFAKKAMKKENQGGEQGQSEVKTLSIDDPEPLAEALQSWLNQTQQGDYFGLQAYLSPTSETTAALQNLRLKFLELRRLATTMGYGPRFLHSTGQLHKGGPKTGLFLQILDEPKIDLPIPETDYSFNSLIKAQALGDYLALKKRKQRVLRVNLKTDVDRGLEILEDLIQNCG
jgi:transaldolase/glucose-6-phosphate isomerase